MSILTDVFAELGKDSLAKVAAWPTLPSLVGAVRARDSASVEDWCGLLLAVAYITQGERDAIVALVPSPVIEPLPPEPPAPIQKRSHPEIPGSYFINPSDKEVKAGSVVVPAFAVAFDQKLAPDQPAFASEAEAQAWVDAYYAARPSIEVTP